MLNPRILGTVSGTVLTALLLVSCYQPTEKTQAGRPPSSYGEQRLGQGYAAGSLARSDAARLDASVDVGSMFGIDGLELEADADQRQAPAYAAYETLPAGGLSLGEGVSAAGLNAHYRNTTLSDADVGGAMNLLEQFGRSSGSMGSQVLGYGSNYLNRAGEGMLTRLVEGSAARLNFRLNDDGKFSGEGDAFLPFYDETLSTAFVQAGVRSMEGTGYNADMRWIGNFGVGQRWYPYAQGQGKSRTDGFMMFGYNAFLDVDVTRSHLRGGAGAEMQADWLHLASNYYFPLSNWKDIGGTTAVRYEEKAAEGVDLRLKGYVPFYRNIAVTGSYGQWFGNEVNGSTKKDPAVWSYGVEYTPIPLLTAYVRQEETDGGKSSTDFGVRLTYRGGMNWHDQISPWKAAEMSKMTRNAFVERENRIITEQRKVDPVTGKPFVFSLWSDDASPFELGVRNDNVVFTVRDPLDGGGLARNAPLVLTWQGGAAFVEQGLLPLSVTTDAQGRFTVPSLTAQAEGVVTLTATHADGRSTSLALSLEEWEVALQWKDGQSISFENGKMVPASFRLVKRPVGSVALRMADPLSRGGKPAWGKETLALEWDGPGKLTGTVNQVATDAQGTFTLRLGGAKAGENMLTARLKDQARDPRETKAFVLKVMPTLAFEVTNPRDLRLYKNVPNAEEIEFFVGLKRDNDDVIALGGVRTEVSWGTGFSSSPPTSFVTDGNGRFRVGAGELKAWKTGGIKVSVRVPDLENLPDWIDAGDLKNKVGETTLEVVDNALTLSLEDPVAIFYQGVATTVGFTLKDAAGRPVTKGAALSWNDGGSGAFDGLQARVTPDGSGRFDQTLTGRKAGERATLKARLDDGRSTAAGPVLKVESAALRVTLTTDGVFYEGVEKEARFRLEDAAGRVQANRKNVALSWGTPGVFEGLAATVDTDARGEFSAGRLKGARIGETTLAVTLADGRGAVSAPLKVQTAALKVRLKAGGPFYVGLPKEARFGVEDATGRAMANQSGIKLRWRTEGVFGALPASSVSNGQGEIVLPGLKGLQIGETELLATLPDGRSGASGPLRVESGALKLTYVTGSSFYLGLVQEGRFRLEDGSGKALANQSGIGLSWEVPGVLDGLLPTVATDGRGEFTLPRLRGLKVGETTLTARLPDGRAGRSGALAVESAALTLKLLTTDLFHQGIEKEARFRLEDASGRGVADQRGVSLSWETEGVFAGLIPTVGTNRQGEFVLPKLRGLKIGETALTARLPNGRSGRSAVLRVESSALTAKLLTDNLFFAGKEKDAMFRLEDDSGRPLANQSGIGLSWGMPGVFAERSQPVSSNERGEIVLAKLKGLKVGETTLTVTLADGRSATSSLLRVQNGAVKAILLAGPPFYAGIEKEARFRLEDGDGKALTNLNGVGLSWGTSGVFEGLPPVVSTDQWGEFSLLKLKGVAVGDTVLKVSLADGRAAASVPLKVESQMLSVTLLTPPPFYVGFEKEARFRLADDAGEALANLREVGLSWETAGVFEGLPSVVSTNQWGEFALPKLKSVAVGRTALKVKLNDGRIGLSDPLNVESSEVSVTVVTPDSFYLGVVRDVRFRLEDGSGKALANQQGIALSWEKGGLFAGLIPKVDTDEWGEFSQKLNPLAIGGTTLKAMFPDGRSGRSAELRVADASLKTTLLTPNPFYAGIEKEARLRLEDGTGRVLANLRGIGLSWGTPDVFEGLIATVSTNEKGEFSLPKLKGLKVGETTLTVKLIDGRTSVSGLFKVEDSKLKATLLTPNPFYTGIEKEAWFRLEDVSGKALANQSGVGLSWGTPGLAEGLIATVSTDERGEFVLPKLKGLKAGETTLTVKLADGRTGRSGFLKIESGGLKTTLLTPNPFYTGVEKEARFRLEDASGKALANQSGVGLSWGASGFFEGLPATVSTDERGEFSLPKLKGLKVGETTLTVKLIDGRTGVSGLFKVEDGKLKATLLTPNPFYTGIEKEARFRLEDASGTALANQSGIGLSWGTPGLVEGLIATVSTDARGEFVLPKLKGLKAGETTLTVKLADGRTGRSGFLKIESGELEATLLTSNPFYVGIEKEARFRLEDASGTALANLSRIALSWGTPGLVEGLIATVSTDARGEFVLPKLKGLKAGETTLTVKLADGRTGVSGRLKVESGELKATLLTSNPFYVGIEKEARFRLEDASGTALANQSRIALSWGTPGLVEGLTATVSTDARGEFVLQKLKGVKVGETTLTVKLADGRTGVSGGLKVESGELKATLLTPNPLYVGVVKEVRFRLDDVQGRPLKNEKNLAFSWKTGGIFPGPLPSGLGTDDKGEFSLTVAGQDIGASALSVTLQDKRSTTTPELVVEDVRINLSRLPGGPPVYFPGEPEDVLFLLQDSAWQPIANRKNIELIWPFSEHLLEGPLPTSAETDAKGVFKVKGLKGKKLGSVGVTARLDDGRLSYPAPVEIKDSRLTVKPGRWHDKWMIVNEPSELSFIVSDAEGNVLEEGTRIRVYVEENGVATNPWEPRKIEDRRLDILGEKVRKPVVLTLTLQMWEQPFREGVVTVTVVNRDDYPPPP